MQHTQLRLRRRAVVISRDRPTTTSYPHRAASCPFLLAAQWSNVCHDHTLCHLIFEFASQSLATYDTSQ